MTSPIDPNEQQSTTSPPSIAGVAFIAECAEVATGVATETAAARARMLFSIQHLLVAARLAREVTATENENIGCPFGNFYTRILGSSVGCILLSTAAAEAYVNELFA